MTITTLCRTETLKWLTGASYSKPTYLALGELGTAPTISDSSMASEVGTRTLTTNNSIGKMIKFEATTNIADSSLYNKTIYETGLFDTSTSGTLFERAVTQPITLTSSTQLTIKKRGYVINTLPALDLFASKISASFTTSANPPTHIAFGTNRILERCESSSVWSKSTDAATPGLNTTNYQEGSAAVTFGKTGTASSTFQYYQTLAGQKDMSEDSKLIFWIYIDNSTDFAKLTTTNTIYVDIGNDNSNYYRLTLDKADIFVGWQRIESVLWTDFTLVGTVNTAQIDYVSITFNTNNSSDTITLGNIMIDWINSVKLISSDDTTMVNEIGSRLSTTKDYVNNIARFVAVLDASTNNGYQISEVSMYDASTSGNILIYDKSINIVKSSESQIRQEFKIQVELNG